MDKRYGCTCGVVLPACALCCLVFAVTQCDARAPIDIRREAAGRLRSITNHTVELIGPWIYIARYLVYLMAKEPVRPDFFYNFLEKRTEPTFKNLINQALRRCMDGNELMARKCDDTFECAVLLPSDNDSLMQVETHPRLRVQVRIHQPYIYQLFQVILVLTNVTVVVSLSTIGLRFAGTCGASSCQDVTINYRLLFQTYTASALIICGCVVLGGVFVLTCDYNINTGVDLLEVFVKGYRETLLQFLRTDLANASLITFDKMVHGLKMHRDLFRAITTSTLQGYGYKAGDDVSKRLQDWNNASIMALSSTRFESLFNDTIENQQYPSAVQQQLPRLRTLAVQIDNASSQIKLDVVTALEESTFFQREGLILVVVDLISKIRGQLHIFTQEIENIRIGVENMTSILLTPEKNQLYIPDLQKVVTWSITSFVVFLCLSMGGMMTGFILGYANHNDRAAPMDRNKLSNVAGYFLVLTSYCMMFGVTAMLFFSGVFMLLGSIGDLYLCRATRGYTHSSEGQLKDLAVSLVMNATINRYHVLKLLRYSTLEQHCVEHQGIAGLAGIRPSDLQDAFDNIVLIQHDLANHFTINIDKLVTGLNARHQQLMNVSNHTDQLKLQDNAKQYDRLKQAIYADLQFGIKVHNDTEGFKKVILQTFQDYSLEKCDDVKNDILNFLDEFDNIGSCRTILAVFEESFRILCNGMLDYVNGFWLAMLILAGVFDYAIYISLVASKYLFTMTTYTYEGEPVPEGTNFEDLQTHRKQKPRRRVKAMTRDEKLRLEQAEKRMSRDPDAVLKDILSPTAVHTPAAGLSPPTMLSSSNKTSTTAPTTPAKAPTDQSKPVAVPPPKSRVHRDELAPEFRR